MSVSKDFAGRGIAKELLDTSESKGREISGVTMAMVWKKL
jgi:hypothetical protein